jgi:hypothetical protein
MLPGPFNEFTAQVRGKPNAGKTGDAGGRAGPLR